MISVPYLVDLDAPCLAGPGQRHLHRDGWGSEGLVDVAGKTPPKWRDEDPFQNYFDAKQATRGFQDPFGTHFTKGLRSAARLGSGAAFLCYWANMFVDGTTLSRIPCLWQKDVRNLSGGFNCSLVIYIN